MPTALRVTAERSFLKTLGGGCSAPVAISSKLRIEKSNQIKISLKGAVWSLDGTEEIEGKEEENIIVKNGLRCSTCPYNNNKYIEDIENLNDCSRCPVSPAKEPSTKRQKLDDIPSEILAADPHEHCPVQIPIGADFMGKCPYLEGILVSDLTKCPVSGFVSNLNAVNYTKCPFLKDAIVNLQTDTTVDNLTTIDNLATTGNGNIKLFCGLVPHKDATAEGMESARILGERLAQTLISRGALEVMSKAQSIIHGSVTAGSS